MIAQGALEEAVRYTNVDNNMSICTSSEVFGQQAA